MPRDDDRAGLSDAYPLRPDLEFTPRAADELRRANRLVLIDCRTREEFSFAHVEGAINIPLGEIESRHDEIEVPTTHALAVMCHHGVRSMKATLALRALGFETCRSVAGGIHAWSLGVDPMIARYESRGGVIVRT